MVNLLMVRVVRVVRLGINHRVNQRYPVRTQRENERWRRMKERREQRSQFFLQKKVRVQYIGAHIMGTGTHSLENTC